MIESQLEKYCIRLDSKKVIKGLEVDILPNGVSISPKNAKRCELILGGLHQLNDRVFWNDYRPVNKPGSFVEDMRITLIKAIESKLIDVLAHPTWLPESIRVQSNQLITQNWINEVVNVAADHNVAIEMSGAWKVPNLTFIKKCLQKGVKLSVGSDAHTAQMIGQTKYSRYLVREAKVPMEHVFLPNTG